MRHRCIAVVVCLGALCGQLTSPSHGLAAAQAVSAGAISPSSKYMDGEILVRFKHGAPGFERAAAHGRVRGRTLRTFRHVQDLELVRIDPGIPLSEALSSYRRHPDVLYAEVNQVVTAVDAPRPTRLSELWGLHNTGIDGGIAGADIHAPEAWATTTGSSEVVVAVIDTGIDYNHVDLAPNMFRGPDCTPDKIDDDNNGFVDDCHGIDTINSDSDPMDDFGHGTHVAGTIGAAGVNPDGVVGVSPNVRLLACKFMNKQGLGSIAGAIACLDYVKTMKAHGVNIVATNNSWAFWEYSQALADAIDEQRQQGILFVAGAGNQSTDNDRLALYPASYPLPNIISVAATTPTDDVASFSNVGRRTVHVGAPGLKILSTLPGDRYGLSSGTSMATPHVTGVAALLKALYPSLDWRAIRNLILSSGDAAVSLGNTVTGRRVNAAGALSCQSQTSGVLSLLDPVGRTATVGARLTVSALHIRCANPDGTVSVRITAGAEVLTLLDNGTGADLAAGDGVYSAHWTPAAIGTHEFLLDGGDKTTVEVLRPYTPSTTTFDYRTIESAQSLQLTDDSSARIDAPFDVLFGDRPFRKLFVSSNGTISVSTPFLRDGANGPLATPRIDTVIAPFWDDLLSRPGPGASRNVFWAVSGNAPNRELVIEWRGVEYSLCPGTAARFEVIFFEGRSDVLFNYANTAFGGRCANGDSGGTATVGVQTSRGSASLFSFNTPNVPGGTAVLWTTAASAQTVTVGFVSPSSIVSESAGAAAVVVRLSTADGKPTQSSGSVDYSSNMTAADGTFNAPGSPVATLQWPTGTPTGTIRTILVPIVDNALDEPDRVVTLTLDSPTGALLGIRQHQLTIQDDDALPTVTVGDASILEGNAGSSLLTFAVRLLQPSGREVSVSYQTSDQTAHSPVDYVGSSGTLVFPPGTTTQHFSVTVNGDAEPEADETFAVNLSNPVNAVVAVNVRAPQGTILDDDTRRVAFTSSKDGNQEIYSVHPDGTHLERLTSDPSADYAPVWSPDGSKLTFVSRRSGGGQQVFVMNADGTQPVNCTRGTTVEATSPSWSRDGQRLIFSGYSNVDPNDDDIYSMSAADCYGSGSPAVAKLTAGHPDREEQPMMSPDGTRIVYTHSTGANDHELYVMNADGSNRHRLAPTLPTNATAPRWSPDGATIVFTCFVPGQPTRVCIVRADGSAPFTALTPGDQASQRPSFSFDGSEIVFTVTTNGQDELWLMSSNGSNRRRIPGPVSAQGPDWQWIRAAAVPRAPSILKQPQDQTVYPGQTPLLSVGADGTPPLQYQWFVCFASTGNPCPTQAAIDGATSSTYAPLPGTYRVKVSNAFGAIDSNPATITAAPSPNGKIAFTSNRDGNQEIYAMNGNGTGLVNLTRHPANDSTPAWSPDGTRLAFVSTRTGVAQIFVMNANGTQPVNCTRSAVESWSPAWSPDGTRILFTRYGNSDPTDDDVYVMSAADCYTASAPVIVPLAASHPDREEQAVWSPDGTRIVYVHSTYFADHELYGMKPDGTGKQRLGPSLLPVNATGPKWFPDGRALLFEGVIPGQPQNVYAMNADGTGAHVLTTAANLASFQASPSPDGLEIVFMTSRDGNDEIYSMHADGTAQLNLTADPADDTVPSWQPLLFTQAPKIVEQPANCVIAASQTCSLTVAATGADPLVYQWYRGPAGLEGSSPVAGASARSLTAGPGEYWVRVSNAFGHDDSISATISIGQPPTISGQPASGTVLSGLSATLSVVASGSGPLTYAWYIGSTGDTSTLLSTATGASYTTPPLTQTTSYWVRVANRFGYSDSIAATLAVGSGRTRRIAFVSERTGNPEIYSMTADGTGVIKLTSDPGNDASPAWSPDGTKLAFVSTRSNGIAQIFVMSADGTQPVNCTRSAVESWSPAWSPDGTRILFTRYGNSDPTDDDVYAMNASDCYTSAPPVITPLAANHPDREEQASWAPDGKRIVYVHSTYFADHELFTMNADGTNRRRLEPGTLPINATGPKWSRDGLTILYEGVIPGQPQNLYSINADGTGGVVLLTGPCPVANFQGTWSPDGSEIAFMSSRDGNYEIYKMPIRPPSGPSQCGLNLTHNSTNDTAPAWQPLQLPIITKHPAGSAISAGLTASMTVAAEGTGPLTFQWFNGVSGDTSSPIDTATADHYSTPPLTQSGSYWVLVSNASGAVASATATISVDLIVIVNPPILTDPLKEVFQAGEQVTLTANVTSPTPLVYEWRRGADPTVLSRAVSYTTTPLTGDTSYTVRVTNPTGVVALTRTLLVQQACQAPVIVNQPISQMIPAGETATLTVEATGTQSLTYQWFVGTTSEIGSPIEGAASPSFMTPPLDTDTTYRVVVSNACQQPATSKPAVISIPTVIVIGHNNGVGEPSTDGSAPLTIVWQNVTQPSAGDVLQLYPSDAAANVGPLSTWPTRGTSGYSFIVFLPSDLHQGTYEIRLSSGEGRVLAVSNPFDVTAPAPSLVVSPHTVQTGGTLTVTWSGVDTPSPIDGFGLVPTGSDTDFYLTWQDTGGSAAGSALMQVPSSLQAGLYEVRLVTHDGDQPVVFSHLVAVTEPGQSISADDGIVVASPPSLPAGGVLTIAWQDVAPTATSVVIARTDVPDADAVAESRQSTHGVIDGAVALPLPRSLLAGLYEVRLLNADGITLVKSNAFAIEPTVAVLSPNGSGSLRRGTTVDITFSHNLGVGQRFTIEASCDGVWRQVDQVITTSATSGRVVWIVDGQSTSHARIRVSLARRPDVNDVSDVDFTVVASPVVTVTSPNGAGTVLIGSARPITFNHNLGVGQRIRIEVGSDGAWRTLVDQTTTLPTSGSYAWIVDGMPTSHARVRVSALDDPTVSDVSDVDFTIAPGPSVTVTAPNGSGTVLVGSLRPITFNHTLGVGQTVILEISRDGGASWSPLTTLATSSAPSGSYPWIVTGPPTTRARVRARWSADSTVSDVSDVNFAIR